MKKIVSVMLTIAMMFTLCSCSANKGNDGEEIKSYTVDELIELNGGEENIRYTFDDDGYLTFFNGKYCFNQIHDDIEAADSLNYIADLIDLENIELTYYDTWKSTVTGYTYYTFYQTKSLEIDGETYPGIYYNSMLKVITDKDGYTVGFSSCVDRSVLEDTKEAAFISAREAEDILSEYLKNTYPDVEIYSNETMLSYIDDSTAAEKAGVSGKTLPAWGIYTDNYSKNASEDYPFLLNFVKAVKNDSGDSEVSKNDSDVAGTSEENSENSDASEEVVSPVFMSVSVKDFNYGIDYDNVYMSLSYFEDKEPGGSYTYKVSSDWAKKISEQVTMPDEVEITVDVMKDKDGLYYLGDTERMIMLSNAFDFSVDDRVNCLVTETPEDINSWHWQIETVSGEEGAQRYFCDINYIMQSYDTIIKVYDFFAERFGFNSAGTNGKPILACMYFIEEEYPESADGFVENAAYAGDFKDFVTFITSPALPVCASIDVMAHEFTHAFNGQTTSTVYENEQGAIMEAYADIVGKLAELMVNGERDAESWDIGASVGAPIRSISNPYKYDQPKFINGAAYIKPIENEALKVEFDNGGVHINNSVMSYLAYLLSHDENLNKGEELLSIEDNLDLWMETLYCIVTDARFDEIGEYLLLCAKALGFTEGEIAHIDRLTYDYGFTLFNENFEDNVKAIEKDAVKFNIDIDTKDASIIKDNYGFGFLLRSEKNPSKGMGELKLGKNTISLVDDDPFTTSILIEKDSEDSEPEVLDAELNDEFAPASDILLHFELGKMKIGEKFAPGEETIILAYIVDSEEQPDLTDDNVLTLSSEGKYVVTTATVNDTEETKEYTIRIIEVE